MMTKDEAKRHLQAAKIMLLGKDGQPISDLYEAICVALDAIDAIEAADKRIAELEAKIPKEGKWIELTDRAERTFSHVCSNCHRFHINEDEIEYFHYCPNCGAKMGKEQTDAID